jgi:hypothetical protein
MKYQFNVNGVVSLILVPENELEKNLLKSLSVQPNEFKETTKSSSVGAQFADGTIIISGTHATKAEEMQRL